VCFWIIRCTKEEGRDVGAGADADERGGGDGVVFDEEKKEERERSRITTDEKDDLERKKGDVALRGRRRCF